MEKLYLRITRFISGDTHYPKLEHHFFNSMAFIGFITFVLATISNIWLGLQTELVLLTLFASCFYFVLYYFGRFRRIYHSLVWVLIAGSLLLFSIMFFFNGGSTGPIFIVLIVSSAFFMFILNDYSRYIFIGVITINSVILFLAEMYYSEYIIYYNSKIQNLLDVNITYIMAYSALFYIIYYARYHYELEKQNALKVEKIKSTFLTSMSHEIRTPMNAILGYSQLLEETDVSIDDKKEYLSNINSNGKLLITLMDNVLDYTEIASGELKIQFSEFDLNQIIRDVYDISMNEINQEKSEKIKLNVHIPKNKPLMIKSDIIRMRQIIENLVNNAIKFTESGTVDFGYDVDFFGNLTLFVRDTGVGISSHEQHYVFDSFRKVNFINDHYRQGIGLGLAITGKLVEALGGEIAIQSKENEGTRIKVQFPKKISKLDL
ncbi:MAG: hypothetical protein JEZ03_07430 [Bacteroidales bacterium]|nr:hypothetical protein [Bacteroidales bacterium]